MDGELRKNPGVSVGDLDAFARRRQVFASSIGSVIDQTRTTSGGGFSALSFQEDGEIQQRSYPNSFGGQYQLKGYELSTNCNSRERSAYRRGSRGPALAPTSAPRANSI